MKRVSSCRVAAVATCIFAASLLTSTESVRAQDGVAAGNAAGGWSAEKCRRYAEAWAGYRLRSGEGGFSAGFVAGQTAFLAGGCAGPPLVCPRTQADLAAADALTLLAMNFGASGTFLPFACPGADAVGRGQVR